MRLTALMENKAKEGLACEHGLAVHIGFSGRQYLLDTGASEQFLGNAEQLGIALGQVDAGVLSHSHYDHSGGYPGFFARNSKAKVYIQSAAREACYARVLFLRRYIGIPQGVLDAYADRFVTVEGDAQIDPGVWLIGHKTQGLQSKGKRAGMYRQTARGWRPDDFAHEQSLVFETDGGLVLLNSCCHGGADVIVEEVQAALPGRPVRALVGGFHLMGRMGPDSLGPKPQEVRRLAQRLLQLGVQQVYTGHCTGNPAFQLLQEELGDRLHYLEAGTVVEFERLPLRGEAVGAAD